MRGTSLLITEAKLMNSVSDARKRSLIACLGVTVSLLVAASWLLVTRALPEMDRAATLIHHSKAALGEVLSPIAKERLKAPEANYSFIVKGKRYFGTGEVPGNLDFTDVHYLESDPAYSAIDTELNGRRARQVAFFLITGVTFLLATSALITKEIVKPSASRTIENISSA